MMEDSEFIQVYSSMIVGLDKVEGPILMVEEEVVTRNSLIQLNRNVT